jgi:hypothetical protein
LKDQSFGMERPALAMTPDPPRGDHARLNSTSVSRVAEDPPVSF